eukprot:TRINITY_DN2113_c0_g1_i1.p1 TRINITY_DN2113_c0_g1~~TRINITY_DN2113_c0_g1_i1.p1  ORF type:complete len:1143 (-),score=265.23 TRINITY_DN2113_c0_g1_i1:444-3872(-)
MAVDIPMLDRIRKKKALDPDEVRTFSVNNLEGNAHLKFPDNTVRTSKYTILTFIPLNLFYQFCRVANFYFLIISAIQVIPGVSPTGQFTTLGTLLVVLGITALKEAYEDFKRHQQDNKVNNSSTLVLRNGQFVPTIWSRLTVGDIVQVTNRQYIPADLVIMSSSEPMGMCYIETANLDGETNLKIRQALEETAPMTEPDQLQRALTNATINCEQPNNRLYNFQGNIQMVDSEVLPLGVKQVLLRGAMLRNTKWVNGVVIFSGPDTKLMKNSSKAPVKLSNLERRTNKQIIFIFIFQILLCTACAIANGVWVQNNGHSWYVRFSNNPATEGALSFLTFLILFNNLIPISLYVSMEAVKVLQAYFINNDMNMYYSVNNTPAMARTSNLNEELGQIDYIFSDKTGTLTQNLMQFRKCSIAGISYGMGETEASAGAALRQGSRLEDSMDAYADGVPEEPQAESKHFGFVDARLLRNLKGGHATAEVIREFLVLLAVCHTVIPEVEPTGIVYQASSPDESALIAAAKAFGFELVGRTPRTVIINVQGREASYEVLNILEFNSTRKRMSVIVRTPEGKILLYCKGADTVIYERLSPDQPYGDITITHLEQFASEGLRTLCLAVAELDPAQYEEWNKIHTEAAISITDREGMLDRAAELVERNLFLLGATAIEDKLQEGVPDTIHTLAQAGIKLWVLTGDKQETAINIGFACQLLTEQMELIVVNEDSLKGTLDEINKNIEKFEAMNSDTRPILALIIDGATLQHALTESIKMRLLRLGQMCRSVICCRVSPLQKALVVKLVKDNLQAITLAIGDGANDVSMIQAAHVGIGISGEEGLQAARSSDYAIAQFRFLLPLLLIHGRNSYRRISKLILYSFYKNIVLYLTQFWFTVLNGWSGQTYYERLTLTAYNVVWTFFPVIIMGVLDKDVGEDMVYDHPQLYRTGPEKYHFNTKVFWGWVGNGLFHSLLIYTFPALIFRHTNPFHSGQDIDLFTLGVVSYTCVVLTVNLKLGIEIRYWTWMNHLFVWGSILVYVLWLMIFGVFFELSTSDVGSDIYYSIFHLYRTPLFYLAIILVPFLCLWRDISWKYVYRTSLPKSYHIVQEMMRGKDDEKQVLRAASPGRSRHLGYSFSQEEGDLNRSSVVGYDSRLA